MHIFRAGLFLSAVTGVGVTWAAWSAGDLVEIALVRGLLGMMAVAFLGYVGELVVLTAPSDLAAHADATLRVTGEQPSALHSSMTGVRVDAPAAEVGSEAEAGESRQAA